MKTNNDTRQKLLDTTRQIIDSGGIRSVSMREIGKKVSLSRSATYRHFNCKEDLIAAIVLDNFKALKNSISELINEEDDPQIILESILRCYYDFGIRHQEHYRLMFCCEYSKELYPDIQLTAFELYSIVMSCIDKVQMQKQSTCMPTKALAAISFAFIHGLVELNLAGHYESEKGLDTPYDLIHTFLSSINI